MTSSQFTNFRFLCTFVIQSYIMKQNRLLPFLLNLSLFLPLLLSAQQPVDIVIQTGHSEEIKAMAFSPDSKRLASASKDGKLIIWDLSTGKMLREMRAHEGEIRKVTWTPDGKWLITGGERKEAQVKVWDWQTGDSIWQAKEPLYNNVSALEVSPDGKTLIAGASREIAAFDMQTGEVLWSISRRRKSYKDIIIKNSVDNVTFSKDSKRVIYNSRKLFWIAETRTGTELDAWEFSELRHSPDAIALSPDEKTLYTAANAGNFYEWNLSDQSEIRRFDLPGGSTNCPCGFNKERTLYLDACSRSVTSMNVKDLSVNWERDTDPINWNKAFDQSPNGKMVAVGGVDNREKNTYILVYSTKNQAKLRTLTGYPGRILSLDISKDGSLLATGSRERNPRVWDLSSSRGYTNYEESVIGNGDVQAAVRFGANDNSLYYVHQHRTHKFDLATTKLLAEIFKGGGRPDVMGVDPLGRFLFITSGFQALHPKTLEQLKELKRPSILRTLEVSPDGKVLLAGGNKEIQRFDTETWEQLESFTFKGAANRIACSPDGTLLAVQTNSRLILLDAVSGEQLSEFAKKGKNPAYHPDGTLLANSWKNDIILRNTTDYEVIDTLKGHTDEINVLKFTPDGRFLVSGGEDTSVKLWDTKNKKLVATLIALEKEDFIIITPDNYYMTSKGGVNGVVFRKGDKLFPFEQFDLYFNRPDIVLERLGYASTEMIDSYKRSYLKRLKKTGFNEGDLKLDFHIPNLVIENREDFELETDAGEITLDLSASDDKYLLDRINVWINDVPVYGTEGIPVKGKAQNSLKRQVRVQLLPGKNKIQISVLNANGVESIRETVEMKYNAPDSKPDLYVISIGTSRYLQSPYNLTYPSKDATDLVNTFSNSPAFEEVHSKLLIDEKVTRENILALDGFLNKAKVNDVVMVFVAGHGLLDKNFDYYFATHDIDFDFPEKRGIEYLELESLLDGITALKKILIMDTCHSGEVDKDEVEEDKSQAVEEGAIVFRNVGVGIRKRDGLGAGNTSELMKELFTDLRRGTGATVISSAGGAEFAMESNEWKNGLFTFCLLHSLKGGQSDLDKDGQVSLSELQQFVTSNVKTLSDGKQIPTCRMENLSLDFDVW